MRTRSIVAPILLALSVACATGASAATAPDGPVDLGNARQLPRQSATAAPALGAYVDSLAWAQLPDSATSNAAGTTLSGRRAWYASLVNDSDGAMTQAAVRIDSGRNPADFSWGGPVAAFPASKAQPTLAPGAYLQADPWLLSGIQAPFQAGFDSTRAVDASSIPPGGGVQTLTVTVTPRDARYESRWGSFLVQVWTELAGVSVLSVAGPATPAGETVETATGGEPLVRWFLAGDRPHVGTTYTFTVTLDVPNPGSSPFEFRPAVSIEGALGTDLGTGVGSATTVAVPSLDGAAAGRGAVRFAVAESATTWTRFLDEGAVVEYAGVSPLVPAIVRVARAGYGNRLAVDIDPDLGANAWAFQVQQRSSTGAWSTLPTTYLTDGTAETRTLTLGPGTFRVVVPAQHDHLGATSAAVGLTGPTVRVAVAKAGYGNKLRVDVDPDRASGYWTFRVQRRTSTGAWSTLPTTYRTYGSAEIRTLTLGPGTFRVRVAAKSGYLGATSAAVRLTNPTVRASLTTDAARDMLRVDVDPDRGTGYWTFRVQRQSADGWTTLATTYRTQGTRETRTIDLGPGRYRVIVAPKYGYLGSASAAASLTR